MTNVPQLAAALSPNKCVTCPHARAATAIIPGHVVACPILTALRAREVYDVVPPEVEVLRDTGYPDIPGDVGPGAIPRGSRYVHDMVVLPRESGACMLDLDGVTARAARARFVRSQSHFTAAHEWINTADRLPTTLPLVQVKVLFTAPGWAVAVAGMYQHDVDPDERWCEREGNHMVFFAGPRPTLWSPMPKLPGLSDTAGVLTTAQ